MITLNDSFFSGIACYLNGRFQDYKLLISSYDYIQTILFPDGRHRTFQHKNSPVIHTENAEIRNAVAEYANNPIITKVNKTNLITYLGDCVDINEKEILSTIQDLQTEDLEIRGSIKRHLIKKAHFCSNINKYQQITFTDIDYVFYERQYGKQIYQHSFSIKNNSTALLAAIDRNYLNMITRALHAYISTETIFTDDDARKPLILSPKVAATLAHELGHFAEEDYFSSNKEISRYFGKKLAIDQFSLCNDTFINDYASTYFFDDEGTEPLNTQIFKNGVFCGIIGRKANARLSYKENIVLPRMTHIYIENGNTSFEEMISTVKNGYYIKLLLFGMEHPETFSLELHCMVAQEISNGKLSQNYKKDVTLNFRAVDLLKRIKFIGAYPVFDGDGYCYKGPIGKLGVKVTKSAPHILLDSEDK